MGIVPIVSLFVINLYLSRYMYLINNFIKKDTLAQSIIPR